MARAAAVDCCELRKDLGVNIDHDHEGVPSEAPTGPASVGDSEADPSGSLAQLFAAISDLWDIDLEDREMALRFEP